MLQMLIKFWLLSDYSDEIMQVKAFVNAKH